MSYSNLSLNNQIALRRALLRSTNGKIFGCTFKKQNGDMRHMACRIGVAKYVKGTATPNQKAVDDTYGYLTVYDFNCKDYRKINLASLTRFKYGSFELSLPILDSEV